MTTPTAARQDRFGERFYPIPHPTTGETHELPSVTRIMKVLANEGLNVWKNKLLVWVVATNPDLAALAATATTEKDKVLYDVVKQALNRRPSAANVGTAAHTLSERVDAGTLDVATLHGAAAPIMERYDTLRQRNRWTVVASEVTAYNLAVGYAGTFDRILDIPGLGRVVSDLKTGKDVYGDTALQLAALANGEGLYDDDHKPYPEGLRRDVGVVIHIPATPEPNKPTGRLLLVDLTEAWPAFQACVACYRWVGGPAKSAVRGEVEAPAPPAPSPLSAEAECPSRSASADRSTDGSTHLIHRIENIRNHHADAFAALAGEWPENVPTFKNCDSHTDQQLAWIESAITRVEQRFQVPFEPEIQAELEEHTRRAMASVVGAFPGAKIVPGESGDREAPGGPPSAACNSPGTPITERSALSTPITDSTLARLTAKFGGRAALLRAGKIAAQQLGEPMPRSAAAVADNPRLTAHLLQSPPNERQSPQ